LTLPVRHAIHFSNPDKSFISFIFGFHEKKRRREETMGKVAWLGIWLILIVPSIAVGNIPESETNNSPGEADPIPLGETAAGAASTLSDDDWWSFSGEAGMEIRLTLIHIGSYILGKSDFILRLWGPGVVLLVVSDNYNPGTTSDVEIITHTLTSTGTHYFSTDPQMWASAARSYTVKTEWLNEPSPTPTVSPTPTMTWTPWVPQTSVEGWEVYR
jgi:hypothetical protein